MGAQRRLGGVDEDHGSKVVGEASGGTGHGAKEPDHGHHPAEGEREAGGASAGGTWTGWIGD